MFLIAVLHTIRLLWRFEHLLLALTVVDMLASDIK